MKRLVSLAVVAFMAVVLTACGGNTDKNNTNTADTTVSQSDDASLNDAAKDTDAKLQGTDEAVTPATPDTSTTTTTTTTPSTPETVEAAPEQSAQ